MSGCAAVGKQRSLRDGIWRARLEQLAGSLDLCGEAFLVGQCHAILAGQHLARQAIQGVAHQRIVLLRAEDEANRWVLVRAHPVLARVVEVEVHLPGIGMRELADLEVDHHETAQPSMEEQQVDSIPLLTDPEPALASNEGEVTSELQEEGLQMVNECLLEVILGVLVSEAEELEDE